MREELRPLVRPLALRPSGLATDALRSGRAGSVEVLAALTGIGMAAAARAAERVLAEPRVVHVVVVGVAGGIGPQVRVGDLVVPELVLDVASGACYRPHALGARQAAGTLATFDGLLADPLAIARLEREGVVAIDMETAAVAAVCERRGCAWSVFRGISDLADGSVDAAIAALARPDGSADLPAVVRLVLREPRRLVQLASLARGLRRATRAAADAAIAAVERRPRVGSPGDAS